MNGEPPISQGCGPGEGFGGPDDLVCICSAILRSPSRQFESSVSWLIPIVSRVHFHRLCFDAVPLGTSSQVTSACTYIDDLTGFTTPAYRLGPEIMQCAPTSDCIHQWLGPLGERSHHLRQASPTTFRF